MNRECILRLTVCTLFVLVSLNAFSQQWQKLDSIDVTRRIGASYCILGGKGYVGFGHDYNTLYPFNDLWEFDPATKRWKNLDYLDGQFRTHAFMFGTRNAHYFGGGTKDSGKTALSSFIK